MVSAIDPTKPPDGVPASKSELRANLQAAKDEIEALQAGAFELPSHTIATLRDSGSAPNLLVTANPAKTYFVICSDRNGPGNPGPAYSTAIAGTWVDGIGVDI